MTIDTQASSTRDLELAARAAQRAIEAREPEWAQQRRNAAAGVMRTLALPKHTDELWRRTDFRTAYGSIARLDAFASPPRARNFDDLPPALLARLAGENVGELGAVVQRDANVVLEQTHPALERQGVIVCSMDRAMREHADKLKPLYGSLIHDDYDWYTAFGGALRSGGAFVWVPDGVAAALPIRLFQWIDGGGRLVAPRTVIALGRGASATVVEEQLSDGNEVSVHVGGTEVFVGEDAKLVFGTMQEWGREVWHYSNQRARVDRGGELQWIQTLLGARSVKTNSYFDLNGPGAQAFVHGFMFGDERQHFHLHTLQRHLRDHCTSDLLIKCCLKDHARSVYQGLIQVSEGAQRTDAYQANRNLLLSDTARADSIPGLEILANDVRCTHGATIGHVDEEQMHYLRTRGLPRLDAQRLIVEGFFVPVLDRIPLEAVREQLRREIDRKIG